MTKRNSQMLFSLRSATKPLASMDEDEWFPTPASLNAKVDIDVPRHIRLATVYGRGAFKYDVEEEVVEKRYWQCLTNSTSTFTLTSKSKIIPANAKDIIIRRFPMEAHVILKIALWSEEKKEVHAEMFTKTQEYLGKLTLSFSMHFLSVRHLVQHALNIPKQVNITIHFENFNNTIPEDCDLVEVGNVLDKQKFVFFEAERQFPWIAQFPWASAGNVPWQLVPSMPSSSGHSSHEGEGQGYQPSR